MEAKRPGTRDLLEPECAEDRETAYVLRTWAEERHLKRPCHCSLEMTVNPEKDKFLPVGI